jgi:hypothetical protein
MAVEVAPSADLGRRASQVSADLSGIFHGLRTPLKPPADLEVAHLEVRQLGRIGRGPQPTTAQIGVMLAAALLGVSAGVLLTRPPATPTPRAPALTALPSSASRPAPPPSASPSYAAAIAPREEAGASSAATPQVYIPPPQVLRPLRPPPRPSLRARLDAGRGSLPPMVGRCSQLRSASRAWCDHSAVMSADRRLRDAYARAVRAGVRRDLLVNYQRRWSDLQPAAANNPRRVVVGYEAMTRDLSRRAANRPPHPPWWR